MAVIKQGSSYTRAFLMVQSSNHVSPLLGATVTVTLSKAGGSFAAPVGPVSEVGNGWYVIALSSLDTNVGGDLAYHCTAPEGDDTDFVDQVIAASAPPIPPPSPNRMCAPGQPPVIFSFPTWTASYPEFSALTPQQGQGYFNRACLAFANNCQNPAFGDCVLEPLLYLLTSHVAWLNCPKDANGNPAATGTIASALVGRISSATEGSVSLQTDWQGSGSPSEAWYIQSRYGAEFWSQTAPYRTARYMARPTRVVLGLLPGLWNAGGFVGR